jgi:glycosyltransferase involved in cell wall biosynthesis
MIVTNVGGLPALVPHEKVGLVAEPDAGSIAEAILRFYQLGENYFIPHLRTEKQKYSWGNLVNAIKELGDVRGEMLDVRREMSDVRRENLFYVYTIKT